MNASIALLVVAFMTLGVGLFMLVYAFRVVRPQPKPLDRRMPQRLWPHTHAVYVDMNGVQPYVLREALYRAGVNVYGIQAPALERLEPEAPRVWPL